MNIKEFEQKSIDIGFVEVPAVLGLPEVYLKDFIVLQECTIDLKIRVTELINLRCFSPLGAMLRGEEWNWFATSFADDFVKDPLKVWLSPAVQEALDLVQSNDTFGKHKVAAPFLFSLIEFHAKYCLGWRPDEVDFYDTQHNQKYFNMSLKSAFTKLQKTESKVAVSFNGIDKINKKRLKDRAISEGRHIYSKLGSKIQVYRNAFMHGQTHSFIMAPFLATTYALFYYHQLRK